MRHYDLDGLRVEEAGAGFSPAMRRALRRGRYELMERRAVARCLRPGDRVLELGGGCGVVSAAAARIVGPEAVLTVEANPQLLPLIAHTHALNGVAGIAVLGAIAGTGAGCAPFHVSEDLWASSRDPATPALAETIEAPVADVNALIAQHRANVLICDIEGAEFDLFAAIDWAPIDLLIAELHPAAAPLARVGETIAGLIAAGLCPDLGAMQAPRVAIFRRAARD